jgi:Polyketide cyclase / dehydrase and lipid transport
MLQFSRVELQKSAEISATADEVWEVVTDWAGVSRWWPSIEEGDLLGPDLAECRLIGESGAVPRTRQMTLDNGVVVEEQIFYQDDAARRICYTKSPTAEVSGYICTTYVDEIDSHCCVLHLSSFFDVRSPADRSAVIARFEAIYEKAIFNGLRRYFAKRASR